MNRNDPAYFSEEYRQRVAAHNPTWMALRSASFFLTWGRDTIFPFVRARQLDHLHYRSLGREIPLVDVVPLSIGTHRLVTRLRDCGLAGPVNATLRLAGMIWLAVDVGVPAALGIVLTGHGAILGQAARFVLGLPASIVADVLALGHAIK